jgi:LPPG:FO 2-phospho-L-lactate transferase
MDGGSGHCLQRGWPPMTGPGAAERDDARAVKKIVALCGGVGGAKLALGLDRISSPGAATIVVNVGDDFDHLGLRICPDVDTVLYTLGNLSDPERGWGRAGESWNFIENVKLLGGDDWFLLGDKDLALHVIRTQHLRAGGSLSDFVARAARQFNIRSNIVPASDAVVSTMIDTDLGVLPFQEYFVRHRCAPRIKSIRFEGVASAAPSRGALDALSDPALQAIVICPSNPYLSVDPILAIPGIRAALQNSPVPVIAVSPIVGGHAIKGPTAKIMAELNVAPSQRTIAAHYQGLIDALVVDVSDESEARDLPIPSFAVPTVMTTVEQKIRLARDVLDVAASLRTTPTSRRGAVR